MQDDFDFKRMDQMALTPCSASKEVCPAPLTCLRRSATKTKGSPMNLRTIGEPHSDCLWYVMNDVIANEKHVFRGNGRRHNKHAPPAGSTRAPDLMVKRHIRNGEDING